MFYKSVSFDEFYNGFNGIIKDTFSKRASKKIFDYYSDPEQDSEFYEFTIEQIEHISEIFEEIKGKNNVVNYSGEGSEIYRAPNDSWMVVY